MMQASRMQLGGMPALEMEEAEHFVVNNGDSKKGNKKSSLAPELILIVAQEPQHRNKIVAAVMGIIILLVVFLANPQKLENPGSHHNTTTTTHEVTLENGLGEFVTVEEPNPSPTTPAATTVSNTNPVRAPTAAEKKQPRPENPRGYSKLSSIPPDPIHPPISAEAKKELADRWGKWKFWDGEESSRPSDDYCAAFPNRDIPGSKFPDGAWQTDAVFVNHYLDAADKLLDRAKEAIYTEYGHGKPPKGQPPLPPEELGRRRHMFHWEMLDLEAAKEPPAAFGKNGKRGIGGWTTKRSHEGLVRRLLHAMLTSDTFTVVLGGHSAAAGQGNYFRQSYMMQFHRVMAPVFARLGVKLVTRNMAQGGMGTVHSSIGSGSIYGNEVDLLIWDSGMTEGHNPQHIDLFLRQGLIGGNRVPVVWGGMFELLQMLHQQADADVGEFGFGVDGIPQVINAEQAKTIPWAARFMNCSQESVSLCHEEPRFCSECWIDRDDGIKPSAGQKFTGKVKWHPGWREHQLVGRVLAFSMLDALQSAVALWGERTMSGQPLDEGFWHVTDYYNNIRNKVKNLDKSMGECYKIEGTLPTRLCSTPMKAKTQYSPRANYEETSLASIVKPAADGYVPHNEKVALYEGPDVPIKCFETPGDATDVLAIISGRRRLESSEVFLTQPSSRGVELKEKAFPKLRSSRNLDEKITPGKGWQVFGEPQGLCDGTYNAVCGRSADNECVLSGHPDGRGAIIGNEYSGWLVMDLKGVSNGIIILKLHTWHYESEQTRTAGWKSVNGEASGRLLEQSSDSLGHAERYLKTRNYDTPPLPDTFRFEYAIGGVVHTLDKDKFLEKKKDIQRVVETITLLDDPDFAKDGARDVEIAVRLTGCERKCTFGISHVYWS